MNEGQFKLEFKGIRELVRNLESLPDKLQKSAEKAVLRAGASPIRKAAKAKAPSGKGPHAGLLKRSIGLSVKKVKGITSARVGPKTGFRVSLGMKIARKTKGKRVKGQPYEAFKDPSFYSHLVEYGTSHSAAKPFIRPAVDQTQSEVLSAMADGLDRHLTRQVAKLKK